jgi:hypothetical protein
LATVAELHETLAELADLLEAHSLPNAAEVRHSEEEVGRSDAHGARRLVGLGKALSDFQLADHELQRRYDALYLRALKLAGELLRATDTAREN